MNASTAVSSIRLQEVDVLRCSDGECRLLRRQDLDIEGSRITAVEPTGTTPPVPGAEVIGAAGMLAVPGLINTHAHVPMGIFRGLAEDVDIETWFNEYMWPLESNLTAEDVYWGMQLGLAEMIAAGVTAVADHYFHMDRAAEAVERAGTRAALGWAVFGSQGAEGVERTSSFAREYDGAADGRITTWLAPHAPYTCDDAFLEAVAAEADELDLGIHIHAAETIGQTEASLAAHRRTPIGILEDTGVLRRPTILAHCCGITSGDIELMAARPCGVAHAPKTYLKLAMGTAPVIALPSKYCSTRRRPASNPNARRWASCSDRSPVISINSLISIFRAASSHSPPS